MLSNHVMNAKFMEHIVTFAKDFKSVEEYEMRRDLFEQNDMFIELHNQTNASFTLGHNQFSTMTEDEKIKTRGLIMPELLTVGATAELDESKNGDYVDWRAEGAVNAIQDQGQCGSCWAFSTMAAFEGAHAVKTGELLKFAEQELVDCSTLNHGCHGGSMALGFNYLKTHYGVLESDYGYTAADGTCQYSSKPHSSVEDTGYTTVRSRSLSQLTAAVQQGVVSVAIEADKAVFQLYKSGVFDSASCGTTLDHGVALVGFGNESGTDYFILRNSWNTTWGEEGYMKIAAQDGDGVCGVNLGAVYPTM
jgi:C1A family cysteine protease